MNSIIKAPRPLPPSLTDEYLELARLDTEQLQTELTKSLHVTAAHLRRLAVIVRLLEERGCDLTDLRIGLLPYLRQIAHGQVLPEVIVRFAESPALIRLIGALPLPDQEKLASGERIPLVVAREGSFEKRLSDPGLMTREQILQVFARDRLRGEEEQILMLEARAQRKPRREHRRTIAPDRATGTLRIGKTTVTVPEVLEALRELRGPEQPEEDTERTKTMPVQLSDGEHRSLKEHSARTGVSMAVLVRRALRAAGLI